MELSNDTHRPAFPAIPRYRLPFGSRIVAALAAAGAIAFAAPVTAQAVRAAETGAAIGDDQVFGFIQFVRWPREEELDRWQICAPAPTRDPEQAGRVARGKPVARQALASRDALVGCQILDLTGVPWKESLAYLEAARKQPVLTIGVGEAFCTAGGTVCLRPGGAGGGFEINLSAAQQSGLKVSAQLLMLGRKRDEPVAQR